MVRTAGNAEARSAVLDAALRESASWHPQATDPDMPALADVSEPSKEQAELLRAYEAGED